MRGVRAKGIDALSAVLVLCASLFLQAAAAQDLEPRKYTNLPVGQNFLRLAAGYSTGEVDISPGIPVEDADLSLWGASVAYVRTFGIGGKMSSVDAYLPYTCADGRAVIQGEPTTREVCGVGDARLRLTYNFIGASAMSLGEFVKTPRELVVGASVQVQAPIGQYDPDRILNIGANRWVFRTEVGMSVPAGRWNVEFAAGVRFFEDNDEFLVDSVSSQDPLYNLQVHGIYDLSGGQWLSLNANYFFGGETFRDGNPTQLRQANSRVGVTWSKALNPKDVIQINASAGVITRVGNDSATITIAWLHRWQ